MMMTKLKPKTYALLIVVLAAALLTVGLASAASLAQSAQNGETLFSQKCRPCHNIGGGDLVGPDLQGVTERQDISWLRKFISAPDKVIASGDPTAAALLSRYNDVVMPNLGLSAAEVEDLLAFLQNPGGASASQASGGILALAGDPVRGKRLFSGGAALRNGGTNCIACHSASGVAALGGGVLGPDLTQVVSRYGGEKAMAGVIASLPFPTMQGVFAAHPLAPQEQADLLAFLVQAGETQAPPPAVDNSVWYLTLGAGGTLVLFAVMAIFWPGQRQSISEGLRKKG